MRAMFATLGLGALIAGQAMAATPTLKDVRWACAAESCQLSFSFQDGKGLPSYYQKYDASRQALRVAFSLPEFAVTDGEYLVDAKSAWVRSVQVSRDKNRNPAILYLDFISGSALSSDRNPVRLKGKSEFVIDIPRAGNKPFRNWNLAKLSPVKKTETKAAPVAPVAAAVPPAPQTSAPPPKVLGPIGAPAKNTIAPKSADKAPPKPAEVAAAKPTEVAAVKGILPEGVDEVAVLGGAGLEQVMVRTSSPLDASRISRNGAQVILDLNGPKSSAPLSLPTGALARSLQWKNGKLTITLRNGANPETKLQAGRLVIQATSARKGQLETWVALPSGIQTRTWPVGGESEPVEDLETFAQGRQKSAALSGGTGKIQVRQAGAAYLAVEDAVPLYSQANERSTVLVTMGFGERMQKLETNGLFSKVKVGDAVGYVSNRQISTDAELSVTQKEKLQRVLSENPQMAGTAVRFETVADERISYSSFGRRDPFIEVKGVVEDGVNIDNTELAGIIWEAEVPMALLSDTKVPGVSYTLHEGDKILNGKVLKITKTDVLFLIQEFGVSRRYSMTLPDKYGGKK